MPHNQSNRWSSVVSTKEFALDMALLLSLSIVGIFGNLLIIVCVILHKKMKNVTSLFVANLAVADLLLAGFVAPGSIRVLWHSAPNMPFSPWCKLFGMALFFSCAATVNFSALIALTRYIVICKSHLVVHLFRHKRSALWCLGLWVYSVAQVALPSATQLFQYNYNPVIDVCHLNYTLHPIAIAVYINCLCFLPCVVVCVACYAMIFAVLRRTRKNLQQHMGANIAFLTKKLTRERRATLPLFISLVSFFVHWLPVMILFGVDSNFEKYNPQIHRYLGIFSIASACDNWIIYGLLNRNFANGYRMVLCYWRRLWGAQLPDDGHRQTRRISRPNSHPSDHVNSLQNKSNVIGNHQVIPLVSEEDFNDLSSLNNPVNLQDEDLDGSSSDSGADEDEFDKINNRCCSSKHDQARILLLANRSPCTDGNSHTQSFELTPVHQSSAAVASSPEANSAGEEFPRSN